ncbi:MAG: GspE/PulE family protein [Halofilum sp. (in: g-proteobacteria)]|nr:GspE/PulE family protein [Halofilum sp. (in: g-proteobacteria)]
MAQARAVAGSAGKLSLQQMLDDLHADGKLSEDSRRLLGGLYEGRDLGGRHPLSLIAERDWPDASQPDRKLTLERLSEWLAEKAGLPYVRIDPLKIDAQRITEVMSYAYARRFNIMALEVTDQEVTIATAEPWQRDWESELAGILKRDIKRVVSNPRDIERYLLEFYTLARSVQRASEDQGDRPVAGASVQNLEQLTELGRQGKLDADDHHVVSVVDWLLQYAFDQRASDIHLEPRRDQGSVRFRIDGVLHYVYEIPGPIMSAVTSRIKILGRMDVAERRRPQDGRIKTRTPDGREIELRLSTLPTAFGEKLVLRIFNPDVLVRDLAGLGLPRNESEEWNRLIHQANGIVLVTGPTGSGKTTTLYSSLKQLATADVNVCTVEDPIELVEPSFNQMQVHHAIDLDFASGVRTLLRQDPDIIMVGEIRDLETAEMATQAALTGHLVLSTLHTNDAPSAITRLLELGVPPYLINGTLLGVMAQRLVRTLCPHCKEAGKVESAEWKEFVQPFQSRVPGRVYRPVGCLECRNTGYLGRTGLYELFTLTNESRALITPAVDTAVLRRQGCRDHMRPLRLAGAQKVASGETTMEEVIRVTPPADGN